MKLKAVFLDKDGTLIKDVPYNVNTALISFNEGVIEGLKLLSKNGYLLIVISNQSGIARGFFGLEDFRKLKDYMIEKLREDNINLDGFYFCPHHPEAIVEDLKQDCDCRKPMPGMLLKASKDLDIDLASSWMVGDILDDVEAGVRAGCKTILIDNGNETLWEINQYRIPDFKAIDFLDAAKFIVQSLNRQECGVM
jgi:D-glycero-D-manno-heptose 1,7-bisphosphate phosphatase